MDAIVAAIIRHQAIGSNTPSSAMPGALPNRWLSDGVTSAMDRALPLKPFICVLWGISGLFVKAGVRVWRAGRAIFRGDTQTKLDLLMSDSVHPEMANWVEIKACEIFTRRHIVDIPRIQFFAQRRYRANWPIFGWRPNSNRRGRTSTDFGKNGEGRFRTPDIETKSQRNLRWPNRNSCIKGIARPVVWPQQTKREGADFR